ncbi:zf-HC2 domain-containing protein [Micromonospora sp. PLK6-60]|uniref:anti-sigma factor family protein n=1 Tax=Micromonospora sp. PLK6-60 TaxID=2873383 RepID=UPI001CA69735|nr:zf-HC2 domain-containing protein [Micromonospora sp. PLK6-60]MBY8871233.1 zf-HC2 domain-containing protein [Micromonospora sp. PLK6-60]
MSRVDHMDVAAYALGVLDQQEAERFEEHLATCWACAAELETMVPVVGLLSGIDGETMMALEQTATDPALLDRTLVAVRADRRRARMRQVLAAAAAVVVFGGLTGVGIASLTDSAGAPQALPTGRSTAGPEQPTPGPTVTGPGVGGEGQLPDGDPVSATDQSTGVKADLWLAEKEFGTLVNFNLTRLPGPRTCRLVVVRKNNATEVVSSWSVPGTGYGTNSNPLPLQLQAATAVPRSDIRRMQIESVDANGVATPLVKVPL